MPVCATCGTSYGSTVRICVRDGTPLVTRRTDHQHLGTLLDAGISGADGAAWVAKATAQLPQTATGNIFTVSGRVLVKKLIGEVTTVLTATATTVKVVFDPTGADTAADLSAVLTVTSDPVGTLYSIVGVAATAMKESGVTHLILPHDDLSGQSRHRETRPDGSLVPRLDSASEKEPAALTF